MPILKATRVDMSARSGHPAPCAGRALNRRSVAMLTRADAVPAIPDRTLGCFWFGPSIDRFIQAEAVLSTARSVSVVLVE